VPTRISAMICSAYSLLEAYKLGDARALAEQARALAAEHRHASHQATAEWTLRTIAYRSDDADAVDHELIQAVSFAAGRHIQGAVLCTEAAIAWRAGRSSEALALARRGYQALHEIQARRGAALLRAFLAALGDAIDGAEIEELCKEARTSQVPGIGIQVFGLLAVGGKLPRGAADDACLERLAGLVPRAHWTARCDILSVEECLAQVRAAREAPPSR
jgi:hypothetical protein